MAHVLVPSDRVERAPVRNRDGSAIGVIERLMLDKKSGKVAYAVIRCAEPFPLPPEYYPLAWEELRYNPVLKAFETVVTAETLRDRAAIQAQDFDFGARDAEYRHPHYWSV